MSHKVAFIFPAFINEFTRNEISFLENNDVDINEYLLQVSKALSIKLAKFSYQHDFYKDELNSQLIAYSFSCAFYDVLRSKQINPDYIAGYSMGIYAALYSSGSISFQDGARLIYKAYNLVKGISEQRSYGMGAIVGLDLKDINKLIISGGSNIEIININNEHSLVVAGEKKGISKLLYDAKEEGALSAVELRVSTPYHSKFLLPYSEAFAHYIDKMQIKACDIPIISTFNQKTVIKVEDIKLELVMNLTQKINWYQTMKGMIDQGVSLMYEVGAGKDLKKISRFIDGDYKFKSVYKIKKEEI